MRHAIIVGEAHSRHGEHETAEAGQQLRQRGLDIAESHMVSGERAIRKRIREAIKSGAELIVVCGGDGTQTHAVAEMATTGVTLGVVPAGTGNSFAHSLGITSIEQAYDAIAHGVAQNIDAGMVNGQYFANFATVGLAAEVGARTPRLLKKAMGVLAYGIAAAVPMLREKPFRARVKWKKNTLDIKTLQMLVVSGRDYGHSPVTPDASPVSGKLTFFATEETNAGDVVQLYAAFLAGTQTRLPRAHYFQAKKIRIKTSRRVLIAVDGEALCKTPATFAVAPSALRVMVPAPLKGQDHVG
jgi:diacylglycerol kinase (ATP)